MRLEDGTCDPALRPDCGDATPFPGGRCLPVGAQDCPADGRVVTAAVPAGARVAHVREGARADGADGSEAHPYASIGDALAGQEEERWLLLEAGTYRGPLDLSRPTHLLGACAARVTIVGGPAAPTVSARADVELRGVTLRGGAGALRVGEGATATLRRVVVASSSGYGLLVDGQGATLDAEDLLVRGVTVAAGHGALSALSSGVARVTRGAVVGSRGHGVRAEGGGTSVTLRDVAIVDVASSSASSGVGVVARANATVRAERTVVDRATENGVYATGGARVTLVDAVVRRSRGFANGTQGLGLVIDGRGHVDATRVLVEDCRQAGVAAVGAMSEALLRDCVVRRISPVGDGTQGTGIGANSGAHVGAEGTLVEASHDQGVIAYRGGASVDLTACEVRGTEPRADMTQGVGVVAHTSARVTLRGVLVRDNHHVGVIAYGRGAVADLHDTMVLGTRRALPDAAGGSLVAHTGGAVTGDHLALANDLDVGLQAYGPGATVVLEDVLVRPLGGAARPRGLGAVAAAGGAVTLARAAFVDVDGAALAALQAEGEAGASRLDATDVFVAAVSSRRFVGSADPFAYALAVERARMGVTRALVAGGEYSFVVDEGALTLNDAVLRDASRGVGVVNASPDVPLGSVSASSPGGDVRRDLSVGATRLPPPPAPAL